jgi:hypothetical protein
MKNVNIKEPGEKFDPNIWESDKKDELFKELVNEYNGLLKFYKKALEKNMHIIVSVI